MSHLEAEMPEPKDFAILEAQLLHSVMATQNLCTLGLLKIKTVQGMLLLTPAFYPQIILFIIWNKILSMKALAYKFQHRRQGRSPITPSVPTISNTVFMGDFFSPHFNVDKRVALIKKIVISAIDIPANR